MMITRETNLNKKDSSAAADHSSTAAAAAASTWSRLKDPRIVRVSKASGGKDRHSKVYTARGLRDRRVRLSVPTAIQLYDLQDRLGFSQPSKVVEWLLTAAKHDIDELPPLEIPPGGFQATAETLSQAWTDPLKSQKSGFLQKGKLSEEASDEEDDEREGTSWGRRTCSGDDGRRFSLETENAYVSDNPFTRQGSSSLSGMLNSSIPYSSFDRWDPSSLSLSHPPRSDGLTAAQPDHEWYSLGLMPIPVAASGSHHHQVLVYQQPGISTQSYNFQAPNSEMSFRCDNESTAAHQALRPVLFTATANLLDLHNDDRGNECNNGSI